MSYSIRLLDPKTKQIIEFDEPHSEAGGIYTLGGTTEAWFNITYNYSQHYTQVFGEKGIRTIYGMLGAESLPVLEAAIAKLDTDTDPDYWKATEGNARAALISLVNLAQLAPHGVWAGD